MAKKAPMPGRRYKIGTKQSLTHTTQDRLVADRALNPFGSLTQQLDSPDYRSVSGPLQRLNLIVASGDALSPGRSVEFAGLRKTS